MVNHQSKNQSKREDIENIIPSNPKKREQYVLLFFYFLIKTSLGSNLGEVGSNDKGYYWKLPNGLIFQWGYHNSGNYITFPIKFEHKCINVELTPSVTSWAGDERHPFIKEITNSYIRYEDRGVDQHYGLNPVYWSAFGN